MRLGIVTCGKLPLLSDDDGPLPRLFAQKGIATDILIWNKPSVNWKAYDCLLLRSPWDYHRHVDVFKQWLNFIETESIHILNPVATLRQNINKFYLQGLMQKGVVVIDTIFIDKTDKLDLSAVKQMNWPKAVIKPAISGGAFMTKVFTPAELGNIEQEFAQIACEKELLVQPFLNEVNEFGEISMLFFNRQYSHAVLKLPKPGDFRVQMEHGGSTKPYQPEESVIKTAADILALIEGDLLYARVDGLLLNGRFVLMELELLEPFLFFEYAPGSINRFVEAAVELAK